MSTPLLATKLIIPTPARIRVDRSRLVNRLGESLHPGCRLALISAPAGFGKTTLLSTWAAALRSSELQPCPLIAWLSLDSGDNDPVIFWSYVIAALQTQQEGIGKQAIALLQTNQLPNLEQCLALLLNELSQIGSPFLLVLDDFHNVRHPAIHRSLSFFIERIPSQFHILLLSRTDPPLPLALLRGRGQLLEIRMNDLRFSVDDAAVFLNSGMELDLAPQAVQLLHGKTEGWIAGLQMAGLSLREAASLQDRHRVEDFITSFSGSNRYILDYLIEEVLYQQPAELQNFLLKTSILDRLCGPLCDALLNDGEPGSRAAAQTVLEQLESNNLFIISLDDQRYWYRYHQLFAELLKKRLYQTYPGMAPELHRRAIQWYEQNGLVPKAVEHAFLMKDYPKAASLISRIVEALWGRGEHVTLLAWMAALPEEEKRRYPQLWVFEVSMLITAGKMQQAEARVQEIDHFLRSSASADPDQASLMGRVFSLRTYIASFYRDIPNLIHYAGLALENLTQDEDAGGRCGVLAVLGNAYLDAGDLPAAAQALVEAVEAGKKAHKPAMVLTAMANLMAVRYLQGELKHAGQVCQEGLHLAQENELDYSPMATNLLIGQGAILCERRELDEAQRTICRGLDVARERNYIWTIAWGCLALIRLRLAQDDLAAAEAAVEEAQQLANAHQIPEHYVCGISGLKAIVWMRAEKIEPAWRSLETSGIQVDGEIQFPHEGEYWALARLCLVRGNLEAGANLLERMVQRAEAGNQSPWLVRTLLLQALLYRTQGMPEQSLQALRKALALAEADGYVQAFVEEGEPVNALLAEAAAHNIHPGYANKLRQSFLDAQKKFDPTADDLCGVPPAGTLSAREKHAHAGENELVDPLTLREIEVIRLIAEGHSNKEIAQKLSLSLRTVKFYATNIYAKLCVTGRTQAVHRARELGLL